MHKNALRSLREYVDSVKGKRRNFSHLSSSSETALGGGEGPGDHVTTTTTTTAPRPVRQLSNASEPPPPENGGEGTEKGGESVPSLVLNGSHPTHTHPPDGRPLAPRTEEGGGGRQGEVTTPIPQTTNNRTNSESSATSSTLQPMPAKSVTAPPTSEEDERRGSMSTKSKPQNFSSKFSSTRVNSETPVPVTSGQEVKTDTATEGTLSISSSQASTVLLSDATTPSHMQVNLSAASLPQEDERKKTRNKPAKQKPLKLELQDVTSENLVNCTLNSRKGQVDFRFSTKSKYDKPDSIFEKLVSGRREGWGFIQGNWDFPPKGPVSFPPQEFSISLGVPGRWDSPSPQAKNPVFQILISLCVGECWSSLRKRPGRISGASQATDRDGEEKARYESPRSDCSG